MNKKNKLGSHFINGKWVGSNGAPFDSFNPSTDEKVWSGLTATSKEVENAIKSAKDAFLGWSAKKLEKRVSFLLNFQKLCTKNKNEFAEIISMEMGKPFWESKQEVGAIIGKLDHSIKAYELRCDEMRVDSKQQVSYSRFHPHGVMVVLGPYNLPGHLPNGHIIPALLAGNTVVFKPSELTPKVGEFMIRLWEESGIPPGVINLLQGGGKTGEQLSKHTDLSGLCFTGSYRVGKVLHQAFAGQVEKILALEMGGNNPLIIWDYPKVEVAVYYAILSSFITTGQRCVCARRILLPEGKVGDEFIASFIEASKKLKIDKYNVEGEPFMGPLISENAKTILIKRIAELEKEGLKPLLAPKEKDKAFLSPGIFDSGELRHHFDEELFGPIVFISRVKNFSEAIEQANNTRYGLAAALISNERELYEQFADRIRAGIVNWNRQTTGALGSQPFGGIGYSGNHRPSAYFAGDYCAYPSASIEVNQLTFPEQLLPGIDLNV